MSMKKPRKIFEEIKVPVIVEGKSDASTLKDFGVEDTVPLNGKPLFRVASSLSKRTEKVLVLSDFDKEGSKIAKKLNSWLESFGVVPKTKLRGRIKRIITKEGVSDIENISPENWD